jgi:predicted nucleic-acid-binding protein
MIGMDTNVLVRFIACDDAVQTAQATSLIESLSDRERGFISIAVVTELVWVLQYVYRLKRPELLAILRTIASAQEFFLEHEAVYLRAWQKYAASAVDFVDCLIAGLADQAGCTETYTFDRKAARGAEMRLLG